MTRPVVLYLESFGSRRKFARTARRVGQRMPVLTVVAGRSSAGQRAAALHTAAAATPLVIQQALFAQAGIITAASLGELIEAAALLACQPLPAGNRVAIVSNTGGAGVLAADACIDNDLQVVQLASATRRMLRRLLPADAEVTGPVDTTAAVTADSFRAAWRRSPPMTASMPCSPWPSPQPSPTCALRSARQRSASRSRPACSTRHSPCNCSGARSPPAHRSTRRTAPPASAHRTADARRCRAARLRLPGRCRPRAWPCGPLPSLARTAAGPHPRAERAAHPRRAQAAHRVPGRRPSLRMAAGRHGSRAALGRSDPAGRHAARRPRGRRRTGDRRRPGASVRAAGGARARRGRHRRSRQSSGPCWPR